MAVTSNTGGTKSGNDVAWPLADPRGTLAVAQHQSFVHSYNWFSCPGYRGRHIDPNPSLKTLTAVAR